MRTITAIMLSAVFSLIAFKEVVYLAFFKVNQDFIAENYCVNKETKACAGHCQLHEAIAKSKEKFPDASVPLQVQEPVKLYYFSLSVAPPTFSLNSSQKQKLSYFETLYPYFYTNRLFRPPIA